jgi:hypothetical protein
MKCHWCGEHLIFNPEKGYVHANGEVYKKKHCVLPEPENDNEVGTPTP